MVDLNKGATVELVKTLSDDLRTGADGTVYESAGTITRKIDNELTDLKNAYSVRTPQLYDKDSAEYINAYVANEVVTVNAKFESFVIAVEPNTHYTMSREHGTWTRWQCDLLETAPET